ncbi:MAG: 4'-phosphopantetheinyl transferase superfamily protein [Deltaproteobacteria bacterium]
MFARLVPSGTAVAALAITGEPPGLFAGEDLPRAVAKRRTERAFGRACARTALAELGVAPVEIITGQGGAPCWPAGLAGSITHTDDHAAAAVTRAVLGLGIDLESLAHTARVPDLLATVAHESERGYPAALVFSAKESVYKCLYAGRFLDFHDVELAIEPGSFTVIRAAGYDASAVRGRWVIEGDHVATVAYR